MPTVVYRPRKKYAQNNQDSVQEFNYRIEKLARKIDILLKRTQ